MQADIGARADRRENLRLGEDLRVRADADLQILRPDALFDEGCLDAGRLRRTGLQVSQTVADDGCDAGADRFGARGIARRPLLDDALDHRAREGDTTGLHRLQIEGRKEMQGGWIRLLSEA